METIQINVKDPVKELELPSNFIEMEIHDSCQEGSEYRHVSEQEVEAGEFAIRYDLEIWGEDKGMGFTTTYFDVANITMWIEEDEAVFSDDDKDGLWKKIKDSIETKL
jgi:hypothetical protein